MTHAWTDAPPRLVASDIDGTLVPAQGSITDRTREALHGCMAAGIDVVLVTGRPPRWMPPVVEAAGFATTAICANGAIVIDTATFEVLDMSPVPADAAREVVTVLDKVVPGATFAVETPTELRAGPGYEQSRRSSDGHEGLTPTERSVRGFSSLEEMLDTEHIIKVVAISAQTTPDGLLDLARRHVGGLVSVTRSALGRALVELGPHGVSKASALERYAASLGIDRSEVIAFGDMPNDVEMLQWAGRGYAMADAHPEAVAAAAFTAPSAEDHGVAQVLEGMLASRVAV